jgi:hypothetical protein
MGRHPLELGVYLSALGVLNPCRDTRALLASPAGAEAAAAFAAASPHPRLWRLLAEHALDAHDWALAEKSFVHCNDLSVRERGKERRHKAREEVDPPYGA